ncbi:MAG: hypothetical protein VKS61_02225 [Candidatus Sericytochromatia bacterium]|nr:hypothetical protein [Candidatus Sericytochromatia bacterium]
MYQTSITGEGSHAELRLVGPDGRMARAPLGGDLSEAARELRRSLGGKPVGALAVGGLPVAVGFALGCWAPGHRWSIGSVAALARLEDGVLTLEVPGAEPRVVALPGEVADAAPVLAGASRAWPALAPDATPMVDDPGLAAGVVLGLALGAHEPELHDGAAPGRPTTGDRGPIPEATLARIRPLWLDLVRALRYGLPTEKLLADIRRLEVAKTHPRAFDGWLADAQRRGRQEKRAYDELVDVVARLGPDAREVTLTIDRTVQRMGWVRFRDVAAKHLEWVRGQRRLREARAEAAPPASRVRAGSRDHRVQAQAPASRWTLYLDESGDGGKKAFDQSRAALKQGYAPWLVGVLVPEQSGLPALPRGFHARDVADPDALDTHLQDLLDAPVGVFGLRVSALPVSHGNAWFQGAMEVVRWTARLLPLEGDGITTLVVCLEQRGDYKPTTDLQATADELMRQLAEVDPDRARRLRLDLKVVAKDASPHLGYADLVAFAWGQRAPHTAAMMAQSGLLGACLLEGDAASLRQAWEALDGGRRPDAAGWQLLVADPDAKVPGSLVRLLLDRVAAACREDVGYWRSLCDGVTAHLDGRDVRLVVLGEAVAELERCRPPGEALAPRVALAFHTARLWHANHLGTVDEALPRELAALGDRLYDEVPALVCQADLVRAVTHTNRFDFAGATAAVARWRGERPAVAGLQHHGRVLSTLGQHAAFTGDAEGALRLFDEALACFARLSEPAMAAREAWQTGTYRAIAAMDAGTLGAGAVRAALEAQAGPLAPEAIARWATDARNPFIHHALLRWLVAHGTPAERAAYREAGGIWETQAFHPWELIEAYRGLLAWDAGDAEQGAGFLESGITLALAPSQGPTVRYIGATLSRLGTRLGWEVPALPEDALRALREALPLAPWAAWDEEGPLATLPAAWAWLGRVLPFNFR